MKGQFAKDYIDSGKESIFRSFKESKTDSFSFNCGTFEIVNFFLIYFIKLF